MVDHASRKFTRVQDDGTEPGMGDEMSALATDGVGVGQRV